MQEKVYLLGHVQHGIINKLEWLHSRHKEGERKDMKLTKEDEKTMILIIKILTLVINLSTLYKLLKILKRLVTINQKIASLEQLRKE